MEFEVKAPVNIPDGTHKGQITKVTYRDEPYSYTDFWINVDGVEGVELKYGCPSTLSSTSKLGKLLVTFGVKLVPGEKHDPEKIMKGRRCLFMTLKKTKDGKEFSEVVDDSLKPEKEGSPKQVGGTLKV
jgi:hypothetical protein